MDPELENAISTAAMSILSLAVVAFTTIVAPMIRQWLRERATVEQIEQAERVAHIAVSATEQIAPLYGLNSQGKLHLAQRHLRGLASQYGINLPEDEVTALLEDAVRDLQTEYSKLKLPIQSEPQHGVADVRDGR